MSDAEDADSALSLVLVTAPPGAAAGIARALVERHLAACVPVVPGIKSFYFWDGALQEDSESTLLIKTRTALLPELAAADRALHSSPAPQVVAPPSDDRLGNLEYRAWVRAETRTAPA